MVSMPEPRPLEGEPLPLDLLNTEFMREGKVYDWLQIRPNQRAFQQHHGLRSTKDLARSLDTLVLTRDVIRRFVADPVQGEQDDSKKVQAGLDQILGHARVRVNDSGGPIAAEVYGQPAFWSLAVKAAVEMIDIKQHKADRVRSCAHPDCVLWFLDISKNGKRRWCSMALCGNRIKARQHYRNTRQADQNKGAE